MKKILFLIPFLFLVSCSGKSVIKCDLEDGIEATISYAIEQIGGCTGTAAVRASVNTWVDSAGSCTAPVKGKIRSFDICGTILTAVVADLANAGTTALNTKFPTWQCNPSATVAALSALANAGCTAVLVAGTGGPISK